MRRWMSSRYVQILAVIAALTAVLLARLFFLTVIQQEKWEKAAADLSVKTIYTEAPRGDIRDRNGEILAGSAYTHGVRLSRENMSDEELNRVIGRLTRLLETNGDAIADHFPVKIGANRQLYYEKGTNAAEFCHKFGFMEELSAKEVFSKLRNSYKIEEELSDAEARKILAVRNELASAGYRKYIPAVIARDVSDRTVIAIEENSRLYPGAEICSQTVRTYPNGSAAAHILGYLGKISDKERQKFGSKQGYRPSALIGKEGVESVYEPVLKGTDGEEKVKVNASGNMVEVLEKKEPVKGKTVDLTIDLRLQKVLEKSLKDSLYAMRTGGVYHGKYGSRSMKYAPQAQTAAAAAIEIKTGQVLAMASFPDFDPNLFVNGISAADWSALQSKNPRDPLAPAPLYNVAARSAVQPGSTFKMVTATAAMACGLDPGQPLYDNGYIRLGDNTFGCVVWNLHRQKHGYLNLQEALEVSCNYYFFDAVMGKDFASGRTLGYRKKLDMKTLMDYAAQYGLGEATGIEIPETVAPAPSGKRKALQLRAALKHVLQAEMEKFFTAEALKNRKTADDAIDRIAGWVGEPLTLSQVTERLSAESAVKKEQVNSLANLCFYSYINQAKWTVGDALNLSIGQGANAYTPLQMANYAATIGNRGIRNSVSLVKSTDGRKKQQAQPAGRVRVPNQSCFDELIGGMTRAANGSGGSLAGVFSGVPVTVAAKTGTAQRSGKINPPDEAAYVRQHLAAIAPGISWSSVQAEMRRLRKTYPDIYTGDDTAVRRALINLGKGKITAQRIDRYKPNYDNFAWVTAIAPAENPEIAVAVMIPQGATASNAGPAAGEILGEYFAQKNKR